MRYLILPFCLVLTVLITAPTWADESDSDQDRADRRAEMRQEILKEFDADGDGELSEDERSQVRKEMRERRGRARGGDRGDRKGRGDSRGRSASDSDRGRPGPPDPEKLFDKFDANGDGQLSRSEFMELSEEVRSHRRGPRPDGDSAERGRRGGPRADGPPEEARRRFDRQPSLQNPGDRPGPPDGRRRRGGDQGPGARDGGPRGRAVGGRGGRQMPSPEAIFNRFDENNDNQLSRAEFMKLADRMREMRQRQGGQRQGDRGQRRAGQGRRGGPPGDDARPGGARPKRPDFDGAGPALTPNDDNSV